jgi:hypothetical protein
MSPVKQRGADWIRHWEGYDCTTRKFSDKICAGNLRENTVGCPCISKSFRTGRLERELQMVQLSTARCSRIAILWVSLVSFATITLCVASQRMFVVYFVIDSARKLLDTPSYMNNSRKSTFQVGWMNYVNENWGLTRLYVFQSMTVVNWKL